MNSTEIRDRYEAALAMAAGKRKWSSFLGGWRLEVAAAELTACMSRLRDIGFNMLVDLTAVDLLEYEGSIDRYRVVYQLLNVDTGERLEVNTHVNDPEPKVPSMMSLWSSANWMEREAYDMFGIVFVGHPNPKRLLLPEEFASFPLRKDYPVKGRGERHNFPVVTRSES